MVGDEMADIYRLRIHNKSSTITLFQKSFQIITTVTEQSLAGGQHFTQIYTISAKMFEVMYYGD